MAALLRARYGYLAPSHTIDHLVIGAGVVGLACAERLVQSFPQASTFLVERNDAFGRETSSRNSEVIHSGYVPPPRASHGLIGRRLHYPLGSNKTALCVRSREMLYKRCETAGIPHRKCGKLTLATDVAQHEYLRRLYAKVQALEAQGVGRVPLQWLSGTEVRELEPDVGGNVVAALLSPETGIVDSHALMADMALGIEQSEMGEVIFGNRVVRIDRLEGKQGKEGDGSETGWVVQTVTGDGPLEERSAVLVKVVINSGGLSYVAYTL